MPASVAALTAEKPRSPSIAARRGARRETFERQRPIAARLDRGLSVAEIAARIGATDERMRALVKEALARRMRQAPEGCAALRASRLNAAPRGAGGAMSDKNPKAVALAVRIGRGPGRDHGFRRRRAAPIRP